MGHGSLGSWVTLSDPFPALACMQCTAQRQQKAANTSLLESRNLLQTATLVFPRPIACSRLSNNINILAKKNFQAANGGAWPPAPWICHWLRSVTIKNVTVKMSKVKAKDQRQDITTDGCNLEIVWRAAFRIGHRRCICLCYF